MGKRRNKKPTTPKIDWRSILIAGIVDLAVGLLLILIERLLE